MDMPGRRDDEPAIPDRTLADAARPDAGRDALPIRLARLLKAATEALDVDQERTRALLRRAAILLHAGAAGGGLVGPAQAALAPWQVKRVARHIDAHIDRPLPLDELARLVGLSNSYFSRAFKGSFGHTPHAFVIRRRIDRAREQMLHSDEPLSQIAVSCGFADQAHLARIFRRQIGAAPSAWRQANREAAPEARRRW